MFKSAALLPALTGVFQRALDVPVPRDACPTFTHVVHGLVKCLPVGGLDTTHKLHQAIDNGSLPRLLTCLERASERYPSLSHCLYDVYFTLSLAVCQPLQTVYFEHPDPPSPLEVYQQSTQRVRPEADRGVQEAWEVLKFFADRRVAVHALRLMSDRPRGGIVLDVAPFLWLPGTSGLWAVAEHRVLLDRARSVFQRLQGWPTPPKTNVDPFETQLLYLGLGDNHRASLERAAQHLAVHGRRSFQVS